MSSTKKTSIIVLSAALASTLSCGGSSTVSYPSGLSAMPQAELPSAQDELATIARRIHFVYLSIVFAVISALFIALLIAGAFVGAFVRTDLSLTIAGMFICAMLALIVCLLLFLREIFLAVSTPRHVPR